MSSSLPPLYDRWIKELLDGPIPVEEEATCNDCPMCSPSRSKSLVQFHPNTKCCTYIPDLPNYLVGRILSDDDPGFAAGREVFESQISGMIITPLGAYPPESYTTLYRNQRDRFGTDPGMLCPFFMQVEGGMCGIWKHRNSRCATWFCKYTRGSRDVIFWKYMDQLLTAVEKSLSHWCFLQLVPEGEALEELFPPPSTQVDLDRRRFFWGTWWERQRDFFHECAALVDALNWEDVLAIGGQEVRVPARLVYFNYGRVQSDGIPQYVKVATWKNVSLEGPDLYRIWAYNRYDPMDVSKAVMDQLHQFDGQTSVADVLRRVKKQGVKIDKKQIRKFLDFGVLEECSVFVDEDERR